MERSSVMCEALQEFITEQQIILHDERPATRDAERERREADK